MDWYWWVIGFSMLVIAGLALLCYCLSLSLGQCQQVLCDRTADRDKAIMDRTADEHETAELKSDNCKMRKAIERQDVLIGELKAEVDGLRDENRKLRDKNSQAIGVLTKGGA